MAEPDAAPPPSDGMLGDDRASADQGDEAGAPVDLGGRLDAAPAERPADACNDAHCGKDPVILIAR